MFFYRFLLGLLFLDSILLIGVILMQAGQGGGMAASFGGVSSSASTLLGTRQTGNLLTKLSWWMGGVFLGLAFILSLMNTKSRAPTSILNNAFTAPPAAPTAPAQTQQAPSGLPLSPAPSTTAPAPATGTGGSKTTKPPL